MVYNSQEYVYGYVINMPFENTVSKQFVGILSNYLSGFEELADVNFSEGIYKVDFIIKNNEAYILEINIIPGMTAQSLLPKAAKVVGIGYSELLDKIIQSALG